MCDARAMDPWLFAAVLAGIVAAVAIVVALRSRARLDDVGERITALQTDLERAQAERRHARDDLADALDHGLMDVDAGLHVVRANPAAHVLLRRPPGGLVGRSLIEVFLDPGAESVAAEAITAGNAVGEVRLADADGPIVVLRARRLPDGGASLVLADVTELRRLQRIRTEFIDNLSHELRTPLTTVSLLAETLTREADAVGDALPAKMRDRIGKIEVETGHLVQMVSELLDLSRIESGSSLGPLEDVDLGRLSTEAVERLRLFAERQDVTLHVEVPGPVPTVRGDPERLGQVLINLVHNAVKFSPDGGDVTISVHPTGETVVVAVTDHGVGVPRAAQARIFERFYKVDRARVRGETGGTGLGLAIARHVIEQHHGRIWVESVEEKGSTFSFALPT
jgi:two-component system, OmpR family, phosphate regulon sensor histidine kinase PhoR